jgi:Mn-containing catalase
MTNDKAIQDFEAFLKNRDELHVIIHGFAIAENGKAAMRQAFSGGHQAGRAAERAEIVAKLENINYCKACRQVGAWHCAHPEDCGEHPRAAITKILEVI